MSERLILIADDDPDLVNGLALRCRSLGLKVETANHALAALSVAELHRPDLAILDVDMPPGSGLAVCEMLVHHPELKQTPVILLTGQKTPATIQRSHELGVYYVPKCADVWPRIEPLLKELLDLTEPQPSDAKPAGRTTPNEAPESSGVKDDLHGGVATVASIPSSEGQRAADLMDAVFSALGCDDDFLGANQEQPGGAPAKAEPPWVLCIDDDAAFSFGLQLRLQEQGVKVRRAFAGRDGYRTAFTQPAQSIILDYELPDGNGDYVLRRLKENPVTMDIPVIVLTGNYDRHLERQMYNLGAAAFMNKPYKWEELWAQLRQFLTFAQTCEPAGAV